MQFKYLALATLLGVAFAAPAEDIAARDPAAARIRPKPAPKPADPKPADPKPTPTTDNGHGGQKPASFKSKKKFSCPASELASCVGDVGGVAATCGQAVADHIQQQQDPATLAIGDLGCVFDLIGSGGSCSSCFKSA